MAESAAERAIRLIDLVPYLLNHPGASIQEVAREFGISTADLIKDLDLLFMCGLPGYTPLELIDLSVEEGFVSLRDAQNLDAPRRFSQTEALVIRVALSALEEMLPVTKRDKVKSVREKISRLYTNEIPAGAIFFENDVERDKMKVVEEAISSGTKLLISYLSPVKSQITDRKISILRIVPESRRTLIEAWCDTSQGIRTFNLANIKALALTSDPADSPPIPVERGEEIVATLTLNEDSHFFLDNQDQLERNGDAFSIKVFQSEWLIRNTLAESGEMIVSSPQWLRQEIGARSKEALRNYSLEN